MAQFSVNAQRFDPYKNFKFRVRWDGRFVAGISKVSALKRTTDVVEHREGGDPSTVRKSPGQSKYDAITLERGVTHDKDSEFQAVPEMDASGNAVAIQMLKLENEGWERDVEVTEPTEPSFTEPE